MSNKKGNTPRRKRYNRKQRLPQAEIWLKTYTGKNVVKSYAKWFGVDMLCAMTELRILGEEISVEFEEKIRKSHRDKVYQNKLKKQRKESSQKNQAQNYHWMDSDEVYAFIAGYTSNGVPFGIRWDEIGEDWNEV